MKEWFSLLDGWISGPLGEECQGIKGKGNRMFIRAQALYQGKYYDV